MQSKPLKHTLSVIVITKNEEDRIRGCLDSVKDIADEIIVFDSGSDDSTVEICKTYTEYVYQTDWPGFGKQKQRALSKATCDWVLTIDADEALDEQLKQSIQQVLLQETITPTAYKFKWGVTIYGTTLKYGRSARYVTRLIKREGAYFTEDEVHESIIAPKGSTGKLTGFLLHFTHRDFGHGLEKSAKYAWLGSQKYHRKGKKSHGLFVALLRSFWVFFHIYFIRKGFLDGGIGFIMAIRYATGSFNKYAGLWVLERGKA
ncbi:glycosyltransferase family 2 protein [Vibrio sp. S11_S32]|nr:glycosyltransferase family 2 protein [Vibrio sp. S11_S32]